VQAAPDGDVAFGAYQRGLYLTALIEAQKRMEQNNDPKAMTLLGELYANGLGVGQATFIRSGCRPAAECWRGLRA